MHNIQGFNKNFRIASDNASPRWVGFIDSRSGFGNTYNGWYTETDKIFSVSNTTGTSSNIYEMTKILYTGNTSDIGIYRGKNKIYKLNYTPTYSMVEYDISIGTIIDMCVDKEDQDYIYVLVGLGTIDDINIAATLYKIDISGDIDAEPSINDTFAIEFATDEQPYYHGTAIEMEIANIINVWDDSTHYIYISLQASSDDENLWFQPWLRTDETDTCRFLYRGEFSSGLLTLNDNTPPIGTITWSDESQHDYIRRITYDWEAGGSPEIELKIGVSGDHLTYTDDTDPYSIDVYGNYGFNGDVDCRFNVIQNTLAEVDGVAVIGINFSSGELITGVHIDLLIGGNAYFGHGLDTINFENRSFLYYVTKDNNTSTLFTQEIFGNDGGNVTVGVNKISNINSLNAFGNNIFFSPISSNDFTSIKRADIILDSIELVQYLPTNSYVLINGPNIIFDVSANVPDNNWSLILHRGGDLALGTITSTSGYDTPTWEESSVSINFDVVDSINEAFDKNVIYQYKTSCLYDGYQESPLDAVSLSPNNTDKWIDATKISLLLYTLKIQFIPSKRVSHINIYRADGDSYYRLLTSIPIEDFEIDPEDLEYYTYTYTDDGTSLASFDAINGYSQEIDNVDLNYKIMTQFNGYLYVTGVKEADEENTKNYLFRSKQGKFSIFDWANDYVAIEFEIDTISSFNGDIIVSNKDNVAIIDSEQMYVKKYIYGVGCDNQLLVCQTPFGIVLTNDDDINIWNGTTMGSISKYINKGENSLADIVITKVDYDSISKKVFFFTTFGATDIGFFSYSFMEKRWDIDVIGTSDVPNILGTFKDHSGRVYISYTAPTFDHYVDENNNTYVDKNNNIYVNE